MRTKKSTCRSHRGVIVMMTERDAEAVIAVLRHKPGAAVPGRTVKRLWPMLQQLLRMYLLSGKVGA